jgi:hypothetical protein
MFPSPNIEHCPASTFKILLRDPALRETLNVELFLHWTLNFFNM